jgi:hypothetical protein
MGWTERATTAKLNKTRSSELFLERTLVLISLLLAASFAKSAPYLRINMRAIYTTCQTIAIYSNGYLGEFRTVFEIGRSVYDAADRFVHVDRTRTAAKG